MKLRTAAEVAVIVLGAAVTAFPILGVFEIASADVVGAGEGATSVFVIAKVKWPVPVIGLLLILCGCYLLRSDRKSTGRT